MKAKPAAARPVVPSPGDVRIIFDGKWHLQRYSWLSCFLMPVTYCGWDDVKVSRWPNRLRKPFHAIFGNTKDFPDLKIIVKEFPAP